VLCTGEIVDNELFAEPVTPAPPPAQEDATGVCYLLNAFRSIFLGTVENHSKRW